MPERWGRSSTWCDRHRRKPRTSSPSSPSAAPCGCAARAELWRQCAGTTQIRSTARTIQSSSPSVLEEPAVGVEARGPVEDLQIAQQVADDEEEQNGSGDGHDRFLAVGGLPEIRRPVGARARYGGAHREYPALSRALSRPALSRWITSDVPSLLLSPGVCARPDRGRAQGERLAWSSAGSDSAEEAAYRAAEDLESESLLLVRGRSSVNLAAIGSDSLVTDGACR